VSEGLLDCLRSLKAGALLSTSIDRLNGSTPTLYPAMPWGPAIDGSPVGLTDTPLSLIKAGKWAKVPLLLGTNNDEGSMFVPMLILVVPGVSLPLNDQTFDTLVAHFFNNNQSIVDQINQHYPTYNYKSVDDKAAKLLRDYFFQSEARRIAALVSSQGIPVYLYHFTYKGDWIEDPFLGVYHSSELEYVFANAWPPLVHHFWPKDTYISNAFGTYWSNMIHVGNPNGHSLDDALPDWPAYNSTTQINIVIDYPVGSEIALNSALCDFWDQINAQQPW